MKEERLKRMPETKQSVMDQMYNNTFKELAEGNIVKGFVVAVGEKEVVIDIGFKSEGFVPIEEFRFPEGMKIGQEIEVLI